MPDRALNSFYEPPGGFRPSRGSSVDKRRQDSRPSLDSSVDERPRGFRSSSDSTVAMDETYDVFISFHGRHTFVSHLKYALKSAGLNPLDDNISLVKGDHPQGTLDAAFEVARAHVAVVSESYAESKYCLAVLAAMMRSGKPVIPVFYDVERAHLRQVETGVFAEAFEKHKSRETVEQVDEWADALRKLADTPGFSSFDHKGNEDKFVHKVVDALLDMNPRLNPNISSQFHEHSCSFCSPFDSSIAMEETYDVFLNYCGFKVRWGFVHQLKCALESAGLSSLDDISLVKRDHPQGTIDVALEVARVNVAVVSQGYAESKYCLTELVAMMRSGKPVIPVFYNVEPAHLREVENGVFAKAFEMHMLREPVEQVQEWVHALQKLADITGVYFRLSEYGMFEDAYVVVHAILECLKQDSLEQDSLEQLVGDKVLLETILEAYYPTIKDVGIDEATQLAQDHSTTIVLGFYNITTNNLEFYFENSENMAKIVGIGLQYGKAIVGPALFIEAQEIEKEEWEKLWSRVRAGLDIEIMVLKVVLPSAARVQASENRHHQDSIDLATSSSNDGVFQEHACGVSNNQFQVPFLCELSNYFIVRKEMDAFHTKCDVQMFDESSKVHCTQEYPGGQSRIGGIGGVIGDGSRSGTIDFWRETSKELFSNLNLDPHSNQGGNGNGGDGNGGDGNGGDGGDGPNHQGKAPNFFPKRKIITTVYLKLLSGGDFLDEERNSLLDQLEQSRLENVVITPYLTLNFCKTITSREIFKEIQSIVGSVFFSLHRNCDDFESCGRFGWFHDELRVSFGPNSEDETEVSLMEETQVEDYMQGKTTIKASSSEETTVSHGRNVKGKVVLGNNNVGRIEVGGDVGKGTQGSNSQSHELSMESPCKQTSGGFYILPTPMPHKAKWEYCYIAPSKKVILEKFKDSSYRDTLSTSPLCALQTTKFSGSWYVHGNAASLPFNFKAVRHLREIQATEEESECSSSPTSSSFSKRWKRKLSARNGKKKAKGTTHICESLPTVQMYEKDISINLAMTHLVDGDTFRLFEGRNFPQSSWHGNDPLADIDSILSCGHRFIGEQY